MIVAFGLKQNCLCSKEKVATFLCLSEKNRKSTQFFLSPKRIGRLDGSCNGGLFEKVG